MVSGDRYLILVNPIVPCTKYDKHSMYVYVHMQSVGYFKVHHVHVSIPPGLTCGKHRFDVV